MTAYAKRPRDFAYLAWVASQQCIICESQHKLQLSRSYAHHAGQRGLGRRAGDRTAIPLCCNTVTSLARYLFTPWARDSGKSTGWSAERSSRSFRPIRDRNRPASRVANPTFGTLVSTGKLFLTALGHWCPTQTHLRTGHWCPEIRTCIWNRISIDKVL